MKKAASFFVLTILFLTFGNLQAQRVPVQITVDQTYGNGGKVEVNLGGFDNEVTAFDITHASRSTTVFGKVSTASPGVYHIGMLQVDSTGARINTFGSHGVVEQSWPNSSDYPNAISTIMADNDTAFIVVGASKTLATNFLPSAYRFNRSRGTLDPTFGVGGKLVQPFDDHSSGEAIHVDISQGKYIICGSSKASDGSGKTGFGIMRLKYDGSLDSGFAVKGRFVLEAAVHSVQGFLLNTTDLFVCGLSDATKEIIIGRFASSGVPDSSKGTNGLIHTGIIVSGDTLHAQLEGDNKVVMLLPTASGSPTHLTICRFNSDGTLDQSYGVAGTGQNDISPSYQPKGFFLSSDFGEIVSGMTNSEVGHSMYVRISDTSSHPDPIFNKTGIIELDVDSGKYPNYLKFVDPIGKLDQVGNIKRFIAVGGSIQNGNGYFMIARFIGHPFSGVVSTSDSQSEDLRIYPNPVKSKFSVSSAQGGLTHVRVIDGLGREVLRSQFGEYDLSEQTFTSTAANIPNGIYYCVAQRGSNQLVRKFVVCH